MTAIYTSAGNLTQQGTLQKETITPEEKNSYLKKLDYETFIQLLPYFVFLIVLILVGVFGNLLVFFVYFKQFKASSTRVFVLAMAVCDFLASIFTLAWMLQDMRYRYTSVDIFCKLKRLFSTLPIFMSYLILVCVALDRRRRICQFHKRQLNPRQATYLMIFAFIVTVCVVCPFAFLYGVEPLETDLPEITGTTCGFSNLPFGIKVKQAYGVAMGIVFSVGFVLLISSYTQISYRIYHLRNNKIVRLNVSEVSHANKHTKLSKNNDKEQSEFNKSISAPDFDARSCFSERSLKMETRDFVECPVNVDSSSSSHPPQDMTATGKKCLEDNCHDKHDAEDVYRRPEKSRRCTKANLRGQLGSSAGNFTTRIPESSIKKSITTSMNVSKRKPLSESLKKISAVESCTTLPGERTRQDSIKTSERSPDLRFQSSRLSHRKKALLSKTTLMMFVLSVATLVFYVPYIAVM